MNNCIVTHAQLEGTAAQSTPGPCFPDEAACGSPCPHIALFLNLAVKSASGTDLSSSHTTLDEIVALGLGFHSQAMPLFEIIPVVYFSGREIIYSGMDSICDT